MDVAADNVSKVVVVAFDKSRQSGEFPEWSPSQRPQKWKLRVRTKRVVITINILVFSTEQIILRLVYSLVIQKNIFYKIHFCKMFTFVEL